MSSTFQAVASMHFSQTLKQQNQPHTLTMHLSFLRRTEVGPAVFSVRDAKLGRGTSTLHVTLSQNGREEVVAYIINTNLSKEAGETFPTSWSLHPKPISPPSDFNRLRQSEEGDENWTCPPTPHAEFRKAVSNVRLFFPKAGMSSPEIADQWMRFTNGERFTNASLGFVVDTFPQIIERFGSVGKAKAFWYPTVLLNLEVKKLLPEEGVEWLFVRTRAKQIKNGRYDLEIVVLDEAGDLVAISHHVVMVVSAARNLAKRSTGSGKAIEGSKL